MNLSTQFLPITVYRIEIQKLKHQLYMAEMERDLLKK